MSYVVHVWEQPVDVPIPEDEQAIWRMLEGLFSRPARPNPRFEALAARLAARFPDDEDDEDGGASVWLEGLPAGPIEGPVWNLGLSSEQVDRSQGIVAWEATGLGLNMADPQAGDLYLADGRILSSRTGAQCMRAQARYESGDLVGAWDEYLRLAAAGNPNALRNLGVMAVRGEGIRRSPELAWVLLDLAGSEAEAEAEQLADLLGTEARGRAERLRSTVTNLRDLPRMLAVAVRAGESASGARADGPSPAPSATSGVPASLESHVSRLEREAARGDVQACHELAYRAAGLIDPPGVPTDWSRAHALWAHIAGKGHPEGEFMVARCLFNGEGVPQDVPRAVASFTRLANAGHLPALRLIGEIYREGNRIEPDPLLGQALLLLWETRGGTGGAPVVYDPEDLSVVRKLASWIDGVGSIPEAIERLHAGVQAQALAGAQTETSIDRWHLAGLAAGVLGLPLVVLVPLVPSLPPVLSAVIVGLACAGAAPYWQEARRDAASGWGAALRMGIALLPIVGFKATVRTLRDALARGKPRGS